MLKGKKTYTTAALYGLFGGIGYYTGLLPAMEAIQIGIQAMGLIGLRAGIGKLQ